MTTPRACPDCGGPTSRRSFLQTTLAATAALAARPALAAPTPQDRPETLVTQLYKSFNEKQRGEMCFAFDHPLRSKVDNNWHITKTTLDANLTADQRDLVKQIFFGLHSEEWGQKVYDQVVHDSGKAGFGSSSRGNQLPFSIIWIGISACRNAEVSSIQNAVRPTSRPSRPPMPTIPVDSASWVRPPMVPANSPTTPIPATSKA